MSKLVIIDHYDSYTHNLVRYFTLLGADCLVIQYNDLFNIHGPAAIVLSPGPMSPADYPRSQDLIDKFIGKVPILGVCLGHQQLAAYYGCRILKALQPMHGVSIKITHNSLGLFKGLVDDILVGCYNSLVVDSEFTWPLLYNAHNAQREVMSLQHMCAPVFGLQFHPESVNTSHGLQILKNFMEYIV